MIQLTTAQPQTAHYTAPTSNRQYAYDGLENTV